MYFHFFSLSLLRIEKDYDMKIRVLYVLLAAWGMMSCVSVQTIGFDQLCPAEVKERGCSQQYAFDTGG